MKKYLMRFFNKFLIEMFYAQKKNFKQGLKNERSLRRKYLLTVELIIIMTLICYLFLNELITNGSQIKKSPLIY